MIVYIRRTTTEAVPRDEYTTEHRMVIQLRGNLS